MMIYQREKTWIQLWIITFPVRITTFTHLLQAAVVNKKKSHGNKTGDEKKPKIKLKCIKKSA